MLYTHIFPRSPLATFVISTMLLFLIACGGGDPAETTVPTDAPATPVPPATEPPPPATVAPAPTTPLVVTEAPGSGAATPVSPTAVPTGAPTAAAQVPTEAPTEVVASNAV